MNYVFDTPDTSQKRKVNLWAIPVWVIDHPVLGGFLITAILGWAFFALHFLWTPFFVLAFLLWFIATGIAFFGALWVIMDFFFESRHEDIAQWVRDRHDRSQRIED